MSDENDAIAIPPAEDAEPLIQGPAITFAEFLENYPTNTLQVVNDFYENIDNRNFKKAVPMLRLWCHGSNCAGYRRFEGRWDGTGYISLEDISNDFLVYFCRDCGVEKKTFCLISAMFDQTGGGKILKVGEFPDLHIDVPNSLAGLLGDEWPYFVKGLKCEKQGFGIAAFSYYRRVVENQRGRMFGKMAEAARRLEMSDDVLQALIAASTEQQFAKAIDNVKDHIPDLFKLNGQNPMKILHSTLSEGLHNKNDEDCLAIAHNIRIVLQDMAQRIKDALRDDAEAKVALTELMKRHARQ